MPVSVTIRNVPEPVRDELAARAARAGQSLQEYLLAELTRQASVPPIEEILARAQARAKAVGGPTVEQVVASIRAARDA